MTPFRASGLRAMMLPIALGFACIATVNVSWATKPIADPAVQAAADPQQQLLEQITTFELTNGMQFLVLEDHSIPNANMYLFWKVGSRNEAPGITGLSHFFEHMMFNGAKKYGPKEFDRVMEASGGANNAYTTEDLTVYTDWFPSSALETIFDLEADRIANLAFDDEVIESERGVVTSERSTGLENSNFRYLWEEVKGVAFRAHPYSWSVIGHQSDIDNWSKQDLIDFYRTYYAPNNAFVVVVGDVDAEQVRKLAEQYFQPIPAQATPREVHTVEPEQKGEKRVVVEKPSASSATVMIAYKTPATQHDDYYPLEVAAELLGDGNSSRLYQRLVEQDGLATEVFTYLPKSFDPNLFYIYAVAKPDVPAAQLEAAILEEVDRMARDGVTDQELQKVKNQKLVGFYREMETINGKANTLGTYQMFFGDWRALFNADEAYQAISQQDIKRVVQNYLTEKRRTVGVLVGPREEQAHD